MNPKTRSATGISIPPPVYFMAALLTGTGLNYLSPLSLLSNEWGYIIASIFFAVSGTTMLSVIFLFHRANTTIDVRKAASALITDGPYRFSRNPAYVSLTLLCLGIGSWFSNGWILLMVVPAILITDIRVVRKEERFLGEKFGEEYFRYKSTVRRWI